MGTYDASEGNGSASAKERSNLSRLVVSTWTLGVAAPLLDTLGRFPTFFLARDLSLVGAVFVVLSILAVPFVVVVASSQLPATGEAVVLRLGAAIGLTCLLLAPLRWLEVGPRWVIFTIGLSAILALTLVDILETKSSLRDVVALLAFSPVVVLLLFFFSETGRALGPSLGQPALNQQQTASPVSVIWLVFDELPLSSLVTPSGAIREDWFPNFASLAEESVWFRNTVTVSSDTDRAVPALLSGALPVDSTGVAVDPMAANYPTSVFQLLRNSHGLFAYEPITRLCVFDECSQLGPRQTLGALIRGIIGDLAVVSGHAILPDSDSFLPRIDLAWGGFAQTAFRDAWSPNRAAEIGSIVGDLELVEEPALVVLHLIQLPHRPYQFDDQGREIPGGYVEHDDAGQWSSDRRLQRQLLQVGYTDVVLGEIIDSLQRSGIYEESIVIVTSDHGISFRPDTLDSRVFSDPAVPDLAYVPLFIKLPAGELGGTIDDYPAETVDVVPTLANIVDLSGFHSFDGVDLFSSARPAVENRQVIPIVGLQRNWTGVLATAERIDAMFLDGDRYRLIPRGAPVLLGQEVDRLSRFDGGVWTLDSSADPASIDPDVAFLPLEIGGVLSGSFAVGDRLAVVVNGVVRAQTEVSPYQGALRFAALLPPGTLAAGDDLIDLAIVREDGSMELIPRS